MLGLSHPFADAARLLGHQLDEVEQSDELRVEAAGDGRAEEALRRLAELGYLAPPAGKEETQGPLARAVLRFRTEAGLSRSCELNAGTWNQLASWYEADPIPPLRQVLRPQAHGLVVRALQLGLRRLGLQVSASGRFDHATARAVHQLRVLVDWPAPRGVDPRVVDAGLWQRLHDPYALSRRLRDRYADRVPATVIALGDDVEDYALIEGRHRQQPELARMGVQQRSPDEPLPTAFIVRPGSERSTSLEKIEVVDSRRLRISRGRFIVAESSHREMEEAEVELLDAREAAGVVPALQRRLWLAGYEPGIQDGHFGAQTFRALLSYLADSAANGGAAIDSVLVRLDDVRYALAPGVFDHFPESSAPSGADLARYEKAILDEAYADPEPRTGCHPADAPGKDQGFFKRLWRTGADAVARGWRGTKEMVRRVGKVVGAGLSWAWKRLEDALQLSLTALRILRRKVHDMLAAVRGAIHHFLRLWGEDPVITGEDQVLTWLEFDADTKTFVTPEGSHLAREHAQTLRHGAGNLRAVAAMLGTVVGIAVSSPARLTPGGIILFAIKVARAVHEVFTATRAPAPAPL